MWVKLIFGVYALLVFSALALVGSDNQSLPTRTNTATAKSEIVNIQKAKDFTAVEYRVLEIVPDGTDSDKLPDTLQYPNLHYASVITEIPEAKLKRLILKKDSLQQSRFMAELPKNK